jgi:dynein heavy chain
MLKEAQGEILDNEELIETLKKSKADSTEIQDKLHKQQKIEENFTNERNKFKDVGKRVSNLYFVVLDLSAIEPTYQWSLESYVALFNESIASSRTRGTANRNANITDCF